VKQGTELGIPIHEKSWASTSVNARPLQPLAFMTIRSFDIISQRSCRGKRIQSEGTSHRLTATKTGDIKTRFTVGMGSGLGFQAVMEPQGVNERLYCKALSDMPEPMQHIAGTIL
jgi:hypothetical protein